MDQQKNICTGYIVIFFIVFSGPYWWNDQFQFLERFVRTSLKPEAPPIFVYSQWEGTWIAAGIQVLAAHRQAALTSLFSTSFHSDPQLYSGDHGDTLGDL